MIRECAFAQCKSLVCVQLNEGLRVLGTETKNEEDGRGVFSGSALKSVVVPSTVKRVGSYCFYGCQHLTDVTLSRGLEVIGRRCFVLSGLREIVIPRTVRKIEDTAFMHTTMYVDLYFEPGSQLQLVGKQDTFFPTVRLADDNAPPAARAVWRQKE